MADEKKITAEQQLADEKLTDDELEGVAGGCGGVPPFTSQRLNSINDEQLTTIQPTNRPKIPQKTNATW